MDRAWELRTKDPAAAIELADPYRADEVAGIAARAGAIVGYAKLRMGELAESEDVLQAALDAAQEAAEPRADAQVQVGLGALRMAQARYVSAATAFRRAQEAFSRAGDRGGEAGAIVNLGLVHRHLGDLPRALELLLDGAARFSAEDDAYGEAVALVNTAQVHADLGDHATAKQRMERAWRIAESLGQPPFAVHVRAQYGAALAAVGEVKAGERELVVAVEEARRLKLPSLLGETLGGLAVAVGPRDPGRAREILREAVALVSRGGGEWTRAMAWITLGSFAAGPAEAREAYETAAALSDEHGEQALSVRAHRGAAEACGALGDVVAALAHWKAAAAAGDRVAEASRTHRLAQVEVSLAVQALLAEGRQHRRQIAELMAFSQARAELVGMLAHELRNPLGTAQLAADLMREQGGNAVHAAAEILQTSHERMARILDATVADAAAERGETALERSEVDVWGLVQAIVDEHRSIAQRKGQILQLDGVPVRALLDSGRLFHALANLLTNAMKYSPSAATILIRVTRAAGYVRVEIDDEGPGVPSENADSLFEPFAKGHAMPTAGERSTGLGLHIARRMVELHGGRMGVSNRPSGLGASFWLEVPALDG